MLAETQTTESFPDICPNCGSPDRTSEPAVELDGIPTTRIAVRCSGCGYHFGELLPLPMAAEAEDAEKSEEALTESEHEPEE